MRRAGKRKKYLYYKRRAAPYVLLAPILFFMSLFLLWPIINVLVMSVREYRLLKSDKRHFIGFQNFVTVFMEDEVFMKAIKDSVIWVAVNVATQTILGFWLAYLLDQKFKGKSLYQALVLSPWVVAGVTVAIIWSLIYGETFGVLNDLLLKLGLTDQNISWFSDSTRAMATVIIANVWRGIPFFTISHLSILAGISDDIYGSARIDGTRTMVALFKITLPMIKNIIVITTLLRSIWTPSTVDLINTLTGGGPNSATMTVPLYIIQKFKLEYNYGYASALAAIASCIIMVMASTYIKIGKPDEEEIY